MVQHPAAHAAQMNRVGPPQGRQARFRKGHVEAAAVRGVALLDGVQRYRFLRYPPSLIARAGKHRHLRMDTERSELTVIDPQ